MAGDDVVECCIANYVSLINMVSLPSDSQIVEIELFRALFVRFVLSYGSPDTVRYHNFDISVRP